MKIFPKLHFWLILPFVITLIGFQGYWKGFSEASFYWHLHALSAVLWYVFLILQPWLYHHHPIQFHRKFGMFALLIAGMVIASALNMIIVSLPIMSEFSPLYEVRYSLAFVDLISISGFTLSIILAIVYARKTPVHARWMISTVFWVLVPGTVRFSFIPMGAIFQPKEFSDFPFLWSDIFIWNQVLIAALILFLIVRDYLKFKTVYFSYVLVLFITLAYIPIIEGAKNSHSIKAIFE